MNDDSTGALPRPPARRGRQALIWTIKIAVSAGLMYVLLRGVDLARLWQIARTASVPWFVAALALYLLMILISSWRWGLLLAAQHVRASFGALTNSYLVATFFNNFLPSNIGGDVIRIRDTAKLAKSKTLAAMVVLVDRGIGLLGLVFVAAVGATITADRSPTVGPIGPGLLWAVLAGAIALAAPAVMLPHGVAFLLRPLRVLHQEWVEARLSRLTATLARFRESPQALAGGFIGAILVQATLVLFYAAVAEALHLRISMAHLAIVVPISFIVQMAPVSVNGLGVREATFVLYFKQIGLPPESAVALSLISAALVMLFSTSGAVVNVTRK